MKSEILSLIGRSGRELSMRKGRNKNLFSRLQAEADKKWEQGFFQPTIYLNKEMIIESAMKSLS